MGKDTAKMYIAFGSIMLLVCIPLMIVSDEPWMLITLIIYATFAASVLYVGYENLKAVKSSDTKEKEREAAMIKSCVGLGHAYLGNKKRSFAFFISIILLSIIIICSFIIMGKDYGTMDLSLMTIIYGVILLMHVILWSALEVNELCNQMNMPKTGGEFEIKTENTDLAITSLFIMSFVLMIVFSIIFAYYFPQNYVAICIAVVISITLIIYIIYIKLLNNVELSNKIKTN